MEIARFLFQFPVDNGLAHYLSVYFFFILGADYSSSNFRALITGPFQTRM